MSTLNVLYAYPILAATGMCVQLTLTGGAVGMARRKFNVPYPDMGSGRHAAKLTDLQWEQFNNVQRTHQNYVENIAQAVTLQLLSGLFFPKWSAALGVTYIVGRFLYAYGYKTYGPKSRVYGAPFMYGATFGQLGMILFACYQMLMK